MASIALFCGMKGDNESVGLLEPPEALVAGAGWRVAELTNQTYLSDASATYVLPVATYTLTFHAAPGFLTPSNRSFTINANQTAALAVAYTNVVPHDAVAGFTNGLPQVTFLAPVGQRYALERSTNLMDWISVITNSVGGDGSLRLTDNDPPSATQKFYRARFVP